MGQVVANMSMSLDGFIAGPNISVDHPMGEGGERLHAWMFGDAVDPRDAEIAAGMFSPATTGAVVMGRRTFMVGERPWGDDGTFRVPCFVITHRPALIVVKGPTTFTFVTEGIERGLDEARATAGDRNINVMGASLVQQYLRAGVIDELLITMVPIFLGCGARPFSQPTFGEPSGIASLERTAVIETPAVTHLRFRVVKSARTIVAAGSEAPRDPSSVTNVPPRPR